MKNYYRILEVDENCDSEEIRHGYRRLAMKFHPDRNQGSPAAERIFLEIAEAYGVLGDPQKRHQYDATMKSGGVFTAFRQEDILRGLFSKPEFRQTLRSVLQEFQKAGLRHDPNFVKKSFFGGKGGAVISGFFLFASIGGLKLLGPAGRAGHRLLKAAPLLVTAGAAVKNLIASKKDPAAPEDVQPPEKNVTFRIVLTDLEFAVGKTIHVYSQSVEHKRLKVNIPPGSKPGQKLRLRGHGRAGKGDLFLLLVMKPQTDSD
ncbi:MAG: DnaJ domain-containing protein [Desulfobulbaceae bacterium]|jgi:DnaJ-class molecular chaperone|nr:DnaJ domain-containing protein [Desulfobulbaceae bacterium]